MAIDLGDLADAVKRLLDAVNAQRTACNYAGPNAAALKQQAHDLGDLIETLDTLAVAQAIDDSQPAVKQLQDTTSALNDALATVQDIKDVINWAALTVNLGAAIASGDPGQVITAGTNLYNAIKA